MTYETPVEKRALEIWQRREMDFPPRVRRMYPDELDRASGTWAIVLAEARIELEGRR
jgi:hypothetical protein